MIKVLHVVSCMNRAGEETFIMNIYRHIDRSKVQFCFLCSQTGPADYDQEIYNLGGEIYYLPTISKSLGPFSYFKEIMIRAKWFADANSTSKCKITKCFCKSTPLVLRNSISFLVSH